MSDAIFKTALPIARALARLAPLHERDEATSEALLALVRAWRRYDASRGPWGPWAARYARQAVVRYLASRAGCVRRPVVDRLSGAAPLVIEEIDRLEAPTVDDDALERLARASAVDAELVALRVQGCSQREAAARLRCNRKTIARREQRVLAELEAHR